MKKKIFALAMTMVMMLAMVACGNDTSVPKPMADTETETTDEVAAAAAGAAVGAAIMQVDLTPASTVVNTATQAAVGHVSQALSMFVELMQNGAVAGTESTDDDAEVITDTMSEMADDMADILDEARTKDDIGDGIQSKNNKPDVDVSNDAKTKKDVRDDVPSKNDALVAE